MVFLLYSVFYFCCFCAACRILFPWPGIRLVLPAVEVQSLNHWTAGNSLPYSVNVESYIGFFLNVYWGLLRCNFLFLTQNLFLIFKIFGCAGSSLLLLGFLFVEAWGLLIVVASLLLWSTDCRHLSFGSCGWQALEHGLSSCGTKA